MLPKNCVRKRSSRSHRQPTYSSLSRYQRSMRHRFEHYSPSISVSDEQQRLTQIALTNANEPNGLAKSGSDVRPAAAIATTEAAGYMRSVSRGSSQMTMMTSLSKQALNNEGNNNANECLLSIHRSPKAVTLGSASLSPRAR